MKSFEEIFSEQVGSTDVPRELLVPDVPRELAWCGPTIVLGYRGFSYTLMDFQDQSKELFPPAKSLEPSNTKRSDSTFVLRKNSQSVIKDTNGERMQHTPVKWSDLPSALGKFHELLSFFTEILNCI